LHTQHGFGAVDVGLEVLRSEARLLTVEVEEEADDVEPPKGADT